MKGVKNCCLILKGQLYKKLLSNVVYLNSKRTVTSSADEGNLSNNPNNHLPNKRADLHFGGEMSAIIMVICFSRLFVSVFM